MANILHTEKNMYIVIRLGWKCMLVCHDCYNDIVNNYWRAITPFSPFVTLFIGLITPPLHTQKKQLINIHKYGKKMALKHIHNYAKKMAFINIHNYAKKMELINIHKYERKIALNEEMRCKIV